MGRRQCNLEAAQSAAGAACHTAGGRQASVWPRQELVRPPERLVEISSMCCTGSARMRHALWMWACQRWRVHVHDCARGGYNSRGPRGVSFRIVVSASSAGSAGRIVWLHAPHSHSWVVGHVVKRGPSGWSVQLYNCAVTLTSTNRHVPRPGMGWLIRLLPREPTTVRVKTEASQDGGANQGAVQGRREARAGGARAHRLTQRRDRHCERRLRL